MDLNEMELVDYTRYKKIYNIISTIKLIILLFSISIIYFNYANKKGIILIKNTCLDMNFPRTMIWGITIAYFVWLFLSIKIVKFENIRTIQIVENIISIMAFVFIVIISGSYNSPYKFLFLLTIIPATIQLGMEYGITIATVSSIIVLGIDLLLAPKSPVNIYFERDLILVGVFILTAWPLGYYVNIQKESLKEKEKELQILNYELDQREIQKKYIEELVIKNEVCYNLLIRNCKDAILVHRYGKIVFANESAKKLLEYVKGQNLNDVNIIEFIPKSQRNTIKYKIEQLYYEDENIVTFEHNINNNEEKIIQNISTYFIYNGKPTILSILHDVTSKKKVEILEKDIKRNIELLNESREYNKLITEFLSNISHELKTPLNVIFTATQLLSLHDTGYSKQDKYLKIIKQNCYRLMKLINNLLDTTKLDSGYLKLNVVNCNIISLIEEITLSVASYAESKGINIIFDTDVEEKIMAVDMDKIERIILNLLSNAIKFTNPEGQVLVEIMDGIEKITVSVKDTGIGIPQDKIDSIFNRFFQVNKDSKKDKEGSGIGLHLTKSFIEMHEGTIKVKSKPGEGTEFLIKLPVNILHGELKEENKIYEANMEHINMEFSDF